jgi:hypothetical protein
MDTYSTGNQQRQGPGSENKFRGHGQEAGEDTNNSTNWNYSSYTYGPLLTPFGATDKNQLPPAPGTLMKANNILLSNMLQNQLSGFDTSHLDPEVGIKCSDVKEEHIQQQHWAEEEQQDCSPCSGVVQSQQLVEAIRESVAKCPSEKQNPHGHPPNKSSTGNKQVCRAKPYNITPPSTPTSPTAKPIQYAYFAGDNTALHVRSTTYDTVERQPQPKIISDPVKPYVHHCTTDPRRNTTDALERASVVTATSSEPTSTGNFYDCPPSEDDNRVNTPSSLMCPGSRTEASNSSSADFHTENTNIIPEDYANSVKQVPTEENLESCNFEAPTSLKNGSSSSPHNSLPYPLQVPQQQHNHIHIPLSPSKRTGECLPEQDSSR